MLAAQLQLLLSRQALNQMIPLAQIPLPILPSAVEQKSHSTGPRSADEAQQNRVTGAITRLIGREIDPRGADATQRSHGKNDA